MSEEYEQESVDYASQWKNDLTQMPVIDSSSSLYLSDGEGSLEDDVIFGRGNGHSPADLSSFATIHGLDADGLNVLDEREILLNSLEPEQRELVIAYMEAERDYQAQGHDGEIMHPEVGLPDLSKVVDVIYREEDISVLKGRTLQEHVEHQMHVFYERK